MIVSPCLKCNKRNQPKDKCLQYCKILQEVQDYDITIRHSNIFSAIDYADEGRYSINTVNVLETIPA